MTSKLFASLGFFSGINNVTEEARLTPQPIQTTEGYKAVYPLTEARNMDVDDSFALHSRSGLTSALTGTGMHSFWSDRIGSVCYFVSGYKLYRMFEDYSSLELASLGSNNPMRFAEFNSRVYCTNGVDIGYIEGSTYSGLPNPTPEFKMPLPAGQCLMVFNASLYVANGEVLYIADPLSDCYDIRFGFRVFDSYIKTMVAVDEGFYISDNKTWFVQKQPVLQSDGYGLKRNFVDSAWITPGTELQVDGKLVSENGVDGRVAIWVSEKGICIGDNKGQVTKLTEYKYSFDPYVKGSAVIRTINGVSHYIATLRG